MSKTKHVEQSFTIEQLTIILLDYLSQSAFNKIIISRYLADATQ